MFKLKAFIRKWYSSPTVYTANTTPIALMQKNFVSLESSSQTTGSPFYKLFIAFLAACADFQLLSGNVPELACNEAGK